MKTPTEHRADGYLGQSDTDGDYPTVVSASAGCLTRLAVDHNRWKNALLAGLDLLGT